MAATYARADSGLFLLCSVTNDSGEIVQSQRCVLLFGRVIDNISHSLPSRRESSHARHI